MGNDRIKSLLTQLHRELERTRDVDGETRSLARAIDDDIHRLIEHGDGSVASIRERANELEVRFATDHPVAERFVREIVDALAKLGI